MVRGAWGSARKRRLAESVNAAATALSRTIQRFRKAVGRALGTKHSDYRSLQIRERRYEQMLGRATRRCDDIGKEVFRIFDAVDLYAALDPVCSMKPVTPNPSVTFAKLVDELCQVKSEDTSKELVEQIQAKLQRKKRRLTPDSLEQFEAAAGMGPDDLLRLLKNQGAAMAQQWFIAPRPTKTSPPASSATSAKPPSATHSSPTTNACTAQ